jgi:hypothetical protein
MEIISTKRQTVPAPVTVPVPAPVTVAVPVTVTVTVTNMADTKLKILLIIIVLALVILACRNTGCPKGWQPVYFPGVEQMYCSTIVDGQKFVCSLEDAQDKDCHIGTVLIK